MRKSNNRLGRMVSGLIAACLSSVAFCAPVSLEFRGATVLEITDVVFREVMKRDFVLAPDVLTIDKRVTVSVKNVEPDKMLPLVRGILKTVDVQVEEREGVLYVDRGARSSQALLQRLQAVQEAPEEGREGQPLPRSPNAPQNAPQADGEEPEIESYRPRGRSVEFLSAVAGARALTNQILWRPSVKLTALLSAIDGDNRFRYIADGTDIYLTIGASPASLEHGINVFGTLDIPFRPIRIVLAQPVSCWEDIRRAA